ncbi:MAG: TIGR00375 family protein [Methanobacterium sp.]|uniref:TIGR00375 family protein n=1 Tax=Methanobacterium sp. TaxID=2164 RepID=UPI003D6463BE|nr:TIGR00375 family protein [Methanobacterium sp.]
MIINSDLHVHSPYSMATSKNMLISTIAYQSKLKGLDLIGTGDAFHPEWLKIIESSTEPSKTGIYSVKESENGSKVQLLKTVDAPEIEAEKCKFILTAEIEDKNRVHQLIILPSIESAYEIREELPSKNINKEGRPRIDMDGAEIMDLVRDYNGLIGPSHAFTPWTSIYKEFDSIYNCYNDTPDFLELGLSADTNMADRIEELQDIPFLSNSDAHSPWPHRLGREFNEIEIKEMTFNAFKDAIKGKKVVGNYGFDPRLGKYHETGCVRCYQLFSIEEARKLKMRCPCGGLIKIGVKDRISDMAKWDEAHHPEFRPQYTHILPLAEIISIVYGKGITTVFVQKIWKGLVQEFGSEIAVLIHVPLEEISKTDSKLAEVIMAFRENTLKIQPGAGGNYGKIMLD